MNNIFKSFLILAFMLPLNLQAANTFQVLDKGLDGDQRNYQIICTNGVRATVTKIYEIVVNPDVEVDHERRTGAAATKTTLKSICVTTSDDKETCQSSWSVDDAAKSVCS